MGDMADYRMIEAKSGTLLWADSQAQWCIHGAIDHTETYKNYSGSVSRTWYMDFIQASMHL